MSEQQHEGNTPILGGGGKSILGFVLVIVLACWGINQAGFDFSDLNATPTDNDADNAVDDLSIECKVNDSAAVGLTSDRLQTCIDAKEHAASQLSVAEFTCLEEMWTRESNWSAWAVNESSGTFGIPQIHPKVHGYPVELGDWKGQVDWGLDYIQSDYDTPCEAWKFWQRTDVRCKPKAEGCRNPYGDHWY